MSSTNELHRKEFQMKKYFSFLTAVFIATLTFNAYALNVGDSAPCVILDHTQNGTDSSHCIRDPQTVGQPVILEFFSVTCSDCMRNLPHIKTLSADLKDKATVRLISIDRDQQSVRNYIEAQDINLEVAFDSERDARRAYHVSVTPTLYVLDKENTVIYKHVGVLTTQSYQEIIDIVESLQK